MRHRTSEVKAIREILESEDFPDADSMAKALIEKVYDLFQDRDFYGLRWGMMAVGPFIDKAEANRAAKAMDDLPTVHRMTAVASFNNWCQRMYPQSSEYCEECKHPTFAHGFSNHLGCVVRRPKPCECKRTYK